MNPPQTQLLTDTWVLATWDEYVQMIEDPVYEKAKGYYHNGEMRIEMAPLGHDHAADNTIVSFAITLFCGLREIPAKGLTNCTYRKQGLNDAQPDVSYYFSGDVDVVPWGTTIIHLDLYPPPTLVIEIANTSLPDDIGEKRLLYEDLEVKEYWVLDVKKVQILAFAIENNGSRRITESQVLPGLAISLLQEALQRTRQMTQSEVVAWLLTQFSK
jgi:Uma2 family endonuclease